MSLRVEIVQVTPFQQNCSVIWCSETLQGAVVDPGGDIEKILAVISQHKIKIEQILLTHGHLDHAGGATELSKLIDKPIIGPHLEDQFWLDGIEQQSIDFGFGGGQNCTPDQWLDEGNMITIGHEKLDVYHCPGHTPGHVIFHHASSKLAFVGDVLFKGSIGRTDFPKGDFDTLVNSIKTKLWPLGDETRFVSGHGPISDFGSERATNSFVADSRFG